MLFKINGLAAPKFPKFLKEYMLPSINPLIYNGLPTFQKNPHIPFFWNSKENNMQAANPKNHLFHKEKTYTRKITKHISICGWDTHKTNPQMVTKLDQVTCKHCLKQIELYNLEKEEN
jgi:hypothetical protein